MYRAIVVEDDPMVASINKTFVEHNNEIKVDGVFYDAPSALIYLSDHKTDLILLDYSMPGMDGLEFMKKLRSNGHTEDVIMVTAARDVKIVDSLLAYGIIDYVIKPFKHERLQLSLSRFIAKQDALEAEELGSQEAVDRLLGVIYDTRSVQYEKGIWSVTLDKIRSFLSTHHGESFTIDSIADAVGLSRVTVRRYVNLLIASGAVVSSVDYSTGGRPSALYTYIA